MGRKQVFEGEVKYLVIVGPSIYSYTHTERVLGESIISVQASKQSEQAQSMLMHLPDN